MYVILMFKLKKKKNFVLNYKLVCKKKKTYKII